MMSVPGRMTVFGEERIKGHPFNQFQFHGTEAAHKFAIFRHIEHYISINLITLRKIRG